MILITGDTHGEFSRFNTKRFPLQKKLNKNDYVIICGDFGGIWNDSKAGRNWLSWLDNKTYTTLFIDGNHENFVLLKQYPVEEWNGGKVQFILESVIRLMRGQVYNIDGKLFFTMGGASSHDISGGILEPNDPDLKHKVKQLNNLGVLYRINRVSWWKEELPCAEEYDEAEKNLDLHNWEVDYIISHCAPISIADTITDASYPSDGLTGFFEILKDRCTYDRWFFGHYHKNRVLSQKHVCIYDKIIEIGNMGES